MPIYRVPAKITWSGPGSPGVNVWHIRTVDETAINTTTQLIKDFYTAIRGLYTSDTTIVVGEDVVRIDVTPPTFAAATRFSTTGMGGTSDAAHVLQLCVTWRTPIATRRGRGRTFIGPLLAAASSTDGSPTDSYVTTLTTAADALVDASTALANGAVVVWSQLDLMARDVTGFGVKDKFAVLRSRRD